MRPLVYGLPFTLLKAINIIKTQTKLTIFQSSIKLSFSEIKKTKRVEIFFVFFLLTINVLFTVLSRMIVDDNDFSNNDELVGSKKLLNGDLEIFCTNNKEVLAQLIWIAVLIVIVIIQGFRARDLPELYQEAALVKYSSVVEILGIICTVIIYFSQSNENIKTFVLYISAFIMNFTDFVLIYTRRIFFILFRAEKNTKEAVNTKIRKNQFELAMRQTAG